MKKVEPEVVLTPKIAWKHADRFPAMCWVANVFEDEYNTVFALTVISEGDAEVVTIAVSMMYAGLARVSSAVYAGDDPEGRHLYEVRLDYGRD